LQDAHNYSTRLDPTIICLSANGRCLEDLYRILPPVSVDKTTRDIFVRLALDRIRLVRWFRRLVVLVRQERRVRRPRAVSRRGLAHL
jgi:hypothetical protein